MRVVITHPTGNEFFRAAIKGFYKADMLDSVYTSIASFPGTFLYNLGMFKIFADIKRRALDSTIKNITYTYPWKEAGRLLAIKIGRTKIIRHEKGKLSVDKVYQSLDKYVSENLQKRKQNGAASIYAYEDGAYYSFKKAKELHMRCFYDLPIGYWKYMHALFADEKELNPAWATTLEGLKDSPEKLNRKDEEIKMADKIFVASTFTYKTLEKYCGTLPNVHVVSYGFPPAIEKQYYSLKPNQKIKLLFVGGLSQRKGLSYLFEAIEGMEKFISLTIVGRAPVYNCTPLKSALNKYTWKETLPHNKVLELMCAHDILVFPSLFEGFGQVITEAMAQGTPVITTERTAGPDIIKHKKNGWLINAGSAEAIKKVLEDIILHPDILEYTGKQALETAKRRPWELYGKELAEIVIKQTERR